MGARLVAVALTPYWAERLNSTQQLVLCAMSLIALDDPGPESAARLYFAGNSWLEQVTGLHQTRVSAALTALCKVGAIRRESAARGWRNARYVITTDEERPLPVDNSGSDGPVRVGLLSGDAYLPPSGDAYLPPSGDAYQG